MAYCFLLANAKIYGEKMSNLHTQKSVPTNAKKYAVGGSAVALAVVMGLQTYFFGENDIENLKSEIATLQEKVAKLEQAQDRRQAALP